MVFLLLASCCLLLCGSQPPDETFYVVTRDDVYLDTYVWLPKLHGNGPWPTVYEKTPYNAKNFAGFGDYFNALGYAYMCQDVRGLHGSNGSYSFFRTSGNDTIDTLKYWLNNTSNWSNGLLSTNGISANAGGEYLNFMGVTQSGYWPDSNYSPYLDIYSIIVTGSMALAALQGHEIVYQGGAFRDSLITGWMNSLNEQNYLQTILDNEAWGNYWYSNDGKWENQWDIINQPMIHFAGWYDPFGQLQISDILSINESSNINGYGQQLLIVDPGGHCLNGDILWKDDLFGIQLWFVDYLPKLLSTAFNENETYNIHNHFDWNTIFYVLGPGINKTGNFWVKSYGFPEYSYTTYYFNNNGLLSTNKEENLYSRSYIYDPSDPLPSYGGNNLLILCGPQNQNVVENGRKDVLHFDTVAFENTWAMFGYISINLYVQSSAVDTDFIGKLVDLYPDGRAMLIQDSILRMRWRNGPYISEQAANMQPNEVYNIEINIGYVNWVFNEGHKLRITISSSNYPRFSVNYNNGLWVKDGNISSQIANNTIWFGSMFPSSVNIPVTSLEWLEERKFTRRDWVNPNPKIDIKMTKKLRNLYRKYL